MPSILIKTSIKIRQNTCENVYHWKSSLDVLRATFCMSVSIVNKYDSSEIEENMEIMSSNSPHSGLQRLF